MPSPSAHPDAAPGIIGHRGAAGHAPENTLASIREAAVRGVRWVEFDVKLSRDAEAVLFHDRSLDRTTDGRGLVCERTLEDLKRLDAGGWFGRSFQGERIPTLREAIALLGELELGANVEIKPDPGRERETADVVVRTLDAAWPGHLPPPILSSFDEDVLAWVRDAGAAYPRALLVTTLPGDWLRRLETLGCGAVHCAASRLSPAGARAVGRSGHGLRCYTVNSRALARRLFGMGVNAVFSDVPDRLMRG